MTDIGDSECKFYKKVKRPVTKISRIVIEKKELTDLDKESNYRNGVGR
jgi:hypothetical protein